MSVQEVVLFQQTLTLTELDNQQHKKIKIFLDQDYEALHIAFSYSPQEVPKDLAIRVIEETLPQYDWEKNLRSMDFLPLKNLVTISLACEGEYLGCRHNKETQQEIIISEKGSSWGFIPQKVCSGQWEIQLNLHCVQSGVTVELMVKGVLSK